jgi:hypothetical protein
MVAPFELAPLEDPYSLVVASDAIQWLDWQSSFPRIATALGPGAYLALVGQEELEPGTSEPSLVRCPELSVLIGEFSTNVEYEPYDLIQSLRDAGVFEPVGTTAASRVTVTESIDQVITRLHSMNGLAPRALGSQLETFDHRARDLLESLAPTKQISTDVRPLIWWGYPQAGGI